MSEQPEQEQPGAILKRIEIILLRIADQMDVELSAAENEVAVLRKRPRRSCPCHAAKPAETGAGVDKGARNIGDPEPV